MVKKMKLTIKRSTKSSKKEKGVWCMFNKNYFRMLVLAGVGIITASSVALANETDKRIEDAAKDSYIFKDHLKDDSVRVKSEDGNVTLTGKVNESVDSSLAEDAVENLPGVKSVNNQIVLKTQPAPEYSDSWVGTKVKGALLFRRNVSATKTQVAVKDGIVTLTGEAETAAQKDLTGKYAQDIEGVKGVVNDIKIVKLGTKKEDRPLSEKIDDASVTAQIKATLLVHRSTSAVKTKVSTTEGVVTLEGQADTVAQKDLVTEIVRDIRGVKDVQNRMTIA